QGSQRLPTSAWIDSLDGSLSWLNKRREWNRFLSLTETTRHSLPGLLPWLEKYPLVALELADVWPQLLAIVAWSIDNPRPNIYLRQVDLPGLHTKFIEAHRGVLAELLDLALPSEVINKTKSGSRQFAARYGFLDKPVLIRFRLLDPKIVWGLSPLCPDIALDAESFSQLRISAKRVFIIENEINFLAFPHVNASIAVFGAGYGWEALARCCWLHGCEINYWGDIDTHGFGILDQLRAHFNHADSFLMDRATLDAHELFWGVEDCPLRADLLRLTQEEQALYHILRDNSIRQGIRLEQEHISFGWLNERLRDII
ncbi:MAG: Wadjet anti-phage system protein JetD domain-containing protein, partial [Terracidiphilus sp.]